MVIGKVGFPASESLFDFDWTRTLTESAARVCSELPEFLTVERICVFIIWNPFPNEFGIF